jgi:hypothetical protein
MANSRAIQLRKAQRALIDHSEPKVEQSYHASYDDLRNGISMRELTAALARHDTEGAIRAMNIEPAAFEPLRAALQEVYIAAGRQVTAAMPPLEKRRG